jgi:hypothetical protein
MFLPPGNEDSVTANLANWKGEKRRRRSAYKKLRAAFQFFENAALVWCG